MTLSKHSFKRHPVMKKLNWHSIHEYWHTFEIQLCTVAYIFPIWEIHMSRDAKQCKGSVMDEYATAYKSINLRHTLMCMT